MCQINTARNSLYMKPSTMLFMFKLKHCVENVYSELWQYTYINEKCFVTLLDEKLYHR